MLNMSGNYCFRLGYSMLTLINKDTKTNGIILAL